MIQKNVERPTFLIAVFLHFIAAFYIHLSCEFHPGQSGPILDDIRGTTMNTALDGISQRSRK
jgi:hypothetical protein